MQRACSVCGAMYDTCYVCEKTKSWRVHTDTLDHYYILTVLMDYKTDRDAKRAYRALRKRGVDFFRTEGYTESVRSLLGEIYREHKGKSAVALAPIAEETPDAADTANAEK